MRKIVIVAITVLLLSVSISAESVDVNHFLTSPSVNGEGGFIKNPSAYVPGYGVITMGLHQYLFKVNYGLFDIVEAGVGFDFEESSDLLEIFMGGDVSLKINALKEKTHMFSIAAGIERMPFNVIEKELWKPCNLYVVASKKVFGDMNISLGAKNSFRDSTIDPLVWNFFMDVSKVINDTVLAIVEYDGEQFNIGFKISINYNISVDVHIQAIEKMNDLQGVGEFIRNHFIFGVTFIQ